MMKEHIILTILLLLSIIAINAQTPISGGAVNGTWTAAGSPYQINGDIEINTGETLTIEPGVEVIFQGYYQLKVEGSLIANGAQGDSILFTINDTTGFSDIQSQNGGWNGIWIVDYTGTPTGITSFDYCIFTYSKKSSPSAGGVIYVTDYTDLTISNCRFENVMTDGYGGAIEAHENNITIEDCLFRNTSGANGGAISLGDASSATIDQCDFYNTNGSWGGAIYINDVSTTSISNSLFNNSNAGHHGGAIRIYANLVQCDVNIQSCIFQNCNSLASGGAIYAGHAWPLTYTGSFTISNSVIYNCTSSIFGGGLYTEYDNVSVENNYILNNTSVNHGGGIYLMICANVICRNNIIANNHSDYSGGGICTQDGSLVFYNNTIVNNNAGYGGGIYRYSGDIDVYNSIIHGNTKNLTTTDNTDSYQCAVNLYNCITDDDPLFVNPTAGSGDAYDALNANWDFGYGSPCHNGGDPATTTTQAGTTDYAGNPRIYDNIIDIGAYEKQVGAGIDDKVSDKYNINIYPNPTSDFLNIELENPQNEKLKVEIIDILGNVVYSKEIDSKNIQLDISNYKKGIYYAKIYSTELIKVEGIVKQ